MICREKNLFVSKHDQVTRFDGTKQVRYRTKSAGNEWDIYWYFSSASDLDPNRSVLNDNYLWLLNNADSFTVRQIKISRHHFNF